MTLRGKFVINDAHFSPFTLCGVGTFLAYSGNDGYRNRGGCTAVPNAGPIPDGKYWIVDRPKGGGRTQLQTWARDKWGSAIGEHADHNEWFALYRDDGLIDDWTWVENVQRGNFRLHPRAGYGYSLGCITLQHRTDFLSIRKALLNTSLAPLEQTGLMTYGCIEVEINENKGCNVST